MRARSTSKDSPSAAGSKRGTLGLIREVGLTLLLGAFLSVSVFAMIKWAMDTHWVLGAAVTIAYAYGAYLGIDDLRSGSPHLVEVHKGLGAAGLTTASAIAVAAAASLLLSRASVAVYEPSPQRNEEYATFASYYTWVLLDIIPGMKAPELLTFVAPLTPKNAMAGVSVIGFRAFVIFGLLAALRDWWLGKQRQQGKAESVVVRDTDPT